MIFKVAVMAVACTVAALSFKKHHEQITVLILIGAGLISGAFILSNAIGTFHSLTDMFTQSGLNFAYLKILLKCLGISFVAQMASDICEDASFTALSSQIITAGKISIILLSMPLWKEVLQMSIGLMKQ